MSVLWWATLAGAAPVLTESQSPVERCVAEARAEIDVPLTAPADVQDGPHAKIALVVGVPCHRRPEIPALAYSSRDAMRVGDQLAADGYHVVAMTDLVDRARFLEVLDHAEAELAPGGEIVVYFSGHGVLATENGRVRRFLVFSDTDLANVTRTGLRGIMLDDRMSRMDAESRVLIQDTCFAASQGGKSLGLHGVNGRAKGLAVPEPSLSLRQGDVRLYAAQYFEQAVESPEHRSSLYTHHLLAALHDPVADLDGDGCVDLREGHLSARERTMTDRAGHQIPQGVFLHSEPPLLGCTPRRPERGVLVLPEGDRWTIEVRDRTGAVVRRGMGPVPEGTYRVQVGQLEERDTGTLTHRALLDARVRVDAGQWLDMKRELARRRRPLTELTLDVIGRTERSQLPIGGGGLTLLHSAASTRVGRPTIGARLQYTSGVMDSQFEGTGSSPREQARSFEFLGLIGHTWAYRAGAGQLAIGPLLGAGAAAVTKCSGPPCRGEYAGLTSYGHAGVRLRWFVRDSWAIALDAGIDGHLRETARAPGARSIQPVLSPTLRVGVGPRL